MRKWLPLLLFFLFTYDVAVDSFDVDCANSATTEMCHACVCPTHLTAPASVGNAPIVASSTRIAVPDTILDQRLNDKSIFHPPKALA